eukprot:NODE_3785_length_634_cov_66.133333_g2723_i0.p3 GENE.NODE_3785_length_634_cov_66.133333_g2723_i0~~NODE_3785_length_634_cov_66.133333_g2723_i0.p3  ORF type:complete len:60 (+),score=7.08 NODE_3785_length_634_cov_66.133333_g2723_i0:148-327(+)
MLHKRCLGILPGPALPSGAICNTLVSRFFLELGGGCSSRVGPWNSAGFQGGQKVEDRGL